MLAKSANIWLSGRQVADMLPTFPPKVLVVIVAVTAAVVVIIFVVSLSVATVVDISSAVTFS